MNAAQLVDGYDLSLTVIHADLLKTYFDCQIRGLTQSCKWIGDLLYALNGGVRLITTAENVSIPTSQIAELPANQLATFLFARSLFDNREYDHCAQTLQPLFVSTNLCKGLESGHHPLSYFLYVYASYLACEKRRANDEIELRRIFEQDGSAKPSRVANIRCTKALSTLRCEIERYTNNSKSELLNHLDPYVLYAFGIVYRRLEMNSFAADLFIRAVTANTCLWPAWYELSLLIKDKEHLDTLKLPPFEKAWMRYFFEAKVFLKLNESERALNILHRLSNSGLQDSGNIQADIALAYDGLRHMEIAAKQFEQLFARFPCRLDNVDAYSNVLFVREQSVELAYLAHRCAELDKYRPETCCVIGNFFSLRGQHDKAVLYFQRALRLKPSYSLVWTLVGHEYTELRNTNAAVHAYRQAIAHNRHDYRAWYGLGQMYEILDLPSFALYYYREAQYLVPTDSRLIVALGEIYERMNRLNEAKKCYWRAHCVGDIEGNALVRLALCFAQCGEAAEAAAAYTEFVKLCEHNGVHNHIELAQAYKYLATYHLQIGHYEDSAAAASKCLEFSETREEAKALFRQITVLAGDIELALADTDDPSSVNGDRDLSVNPTNLKDLPIDRLHLQDTPFPKSSSDSVTTCADDRLASEIGNRRCSEPLGQTKPLDLSLSYLLSVLGGTSTDLAATPYAPVQPQLSSALGTFSQSNRAFDGPMQSEAVRVTSSPPLQPSSAVETPLRMGSRSPTSVGGVDSLSNEESMHVGDETG